MEFLHAARGRATGVPLLHHQRILCLADNNLQVFTVRQPLSLPMFFLRLHPICMQQPLCQERLAKEGTVLLLPNLCVPYYTLKLQLWAVI